MTWAKQKDIERVQHALSTRDYVGLVVKFTDLDKTVTQTVVQVARDPTVVSDGLCIICCEKPSDGMVYPCKHKDFCQKCILMSMYSGKRRVPVCPVCRGTIETIFMY
jgi:hypothetical protein